MALKVYFDLLSQPSRAVIIFLKMNKIPFTACPIALRKAEHLSDEYGKICAFKKVPAIDNGGFKLSESITIMKYLAQKHKVPAHWYPFDLEKRARVDEYLDYHHTNTRINGAMLFVEQFRTPMLTGEPPNVKEVARFASELVKTLDTIEGIFLNNRKFLAGDEISIADIIAACELMQPSISGFDLFSKRPKLNEWLERVRSSTNPHFDEAHSIVRIYREKFSTKYPIAVESKL